MLSLVATPIGNLKDITHRALETLAAADLVASEDTRKTGLLLKHYGLHRPQVSFHEYNEDKVVPRLVAAMQAGQHVALVTNAGTPAISDPGYSLVRAAVDAGLLVTAIPGPAAFVLAVTLSGLPVHSFTFRGFPPRRSGARRRFLQVDAESPHTLIFYESPYRLAAFLEDALAVYGDRPACLANDLTKLFELVKRGPLSKLHAWAKETELKGEFCVVVGGGRGFTTEGTEHTEKNKGKKQE